MDVGFRLYSVNCKDLSNCRMGNILYLLIIPNKKNI